MNEHQALIVSDIDKASVWLGNTSEAIRQDVLKASATITTVTNPQQLESAVARLRDIKRLLAEIETTRKAVKQPALNFGKKTDQIAEQFCIPLEAEAERLNGNTKKGTKGLIGGFIEQDAKRVQKEQEKLAEEKRLLDQQAADALAEQERVANLSKPSPKKEIAAEVKVQETQAAVVQAQTIVAPTAARASGIVVKKEVMFEITEAAALYAVRPEFFTLEPRRSVIKAAITKDTKLPGLKVWEEVNTRVRT